MSTADGKVDLISSVPVNDAVLVLTNNGSGGFVQSFSATVIGVLSLVTADVNGDGKRDLICANYGIGGGNTLTILTNNGSGGFGPTFPPAVGNGPTSVVAADVNGDGKIDLICANYLTNTLSVLFNGPVISSTFSGTVHGSGYITSPMWNANTVLNYNGSYGTLNSSFNSGGGTLVISASGSGYCTTAGIIGVNILLDGVVMDNCQIYANTINVHMAFVPKTLVLKGVAAGSHTLALQTFVGTITDFDSACVTVLEFPF